MLPHSGVSTPVLPTSSQLPIDIRRFPWIRRLAADYAFNYGALAEFYGGDPADPAAWRDTIARVRRHARARDAVANLLQAQQRRRNAPQAAISAAARLGDPETVAIVTGQQATLFGGPLFTLLKALSAVRLAERVSADHHVPAVAVFWIDAEDHDWDEVRACHVHDADLTVRSVSLGAGAHEGAIARVKLDQSVSAVLSEIESLLQPTEFVPDVMESLRRAYEPGAGMADAFGKWLESVLGPRGLVVYDSADPAAKPLVADLFAHEIEHAGRTSRLAGQAGSALQARGYHAQATPADGSLALFHLSAGREPIRQRADGMFAMGDHEISSSDLLDRVRRSPAEFSPNVLLRPLVQDALFPTVCYVSGPSELAYLGQLKGVYQAFGIPMPLIEQRATATLLDANSMRFLTRHAFPLELLRPQDEAALNDLLGAQMPPLVERSMEQTARAIEEQMLGLASAVAQIDSTLEGAARSTLTRMQDDLKKLQQKTIQAAKRKDDTLRRQFRHAQAQAFPGGQPQEREIAFVYFLARYGPALIERIAEIAPGERGMHYVLTV